MGVSWEGDTGGSGEARRGRRWLLLLTPEPCLESSGWSPLLPRGRSLGRHHELPECRLPYGLPSHRAWQPPSVLGLGPHPA